MAGYLTAEHMVTKAIKQKLQDINGYINFFAFEGVRKTSFSSERVRGLNDVLKKYPEVRIIQSIATDWTPKYVEFALPRLLSRYLKCQVAGIWGANSALARTSSQILIEKGLVPNIDFVTSGTDWDKKSVQSVYDGKVLSIAGGHMAIGSWIITLIHDYHNGIDFDSSVYLNKVSLMNRTSAEKFLKYFSGDDWNFIDYTQYSKFENKNLKRYDFSFSHILDNISN